MSSDLFSPAAARSMRRAFATLVATCAATAMTGSSAAAQTQVSGQLVLVERQGAERSDLRTAVVYLEAEGRAIPASFAPDLRQGTIVMTGREFVPHVRIVLAGGGVTFPNKDPFSHNVFSNAEAGPFDLGLYRRGSSRVAQFPRPGVYPIYCNIHSRMVSFVVAVPTPHAAFAGADGRFTISGVAPGQYVLHAWHERAGSSVSRAITVPASGVNGTRVVLDARTYVSGPHLNKFGLPYSATRVDRY